MHASEYVFGPDGCPPGRSTYAVEPRRDPIAVAELIHPGKLEPIVPIDPDTITTLFLVELILKDRWRLHRLLRDRGVLAMLLPRLLTISAAGFLLFGVAASLVFAAAGQWPALVPIAESLKWPFKMPLSFKGIASSTGTSAAFLSPWIDGNALALIGAYTFGLVATSGVCLPSLYFYCLLAGVRMTMLEVVVHAVKAKAIAAVALVGILPIYVAMAMGAVIFHGGEQLITRTMMLGLLLPFIAGLWGTASLYYGFAQLSDTMPPDRAACRTSFLRLLVLSWSVCYTAVMPVMVHSVWVALVRV